jgi:hypothetical protein
MIMEQNLNNERRQSSQRRHVDLGPPAGIAERRINIERRLFNLGTDRGEEWLTRAPSGMTRKGRASDH